jgi:hypothetical protein
LETGQIGCNVTLVRRYRYLLSNNQEGRSSLLIRGGNLKSLLLGVRGRTVVTSLSKFLYRNYGKQNDEIFMVKNISLHRHASQYDLQLSNLKTWSEKDAYEFFENRKKYITFSLEYNRTFTKGRVPNRPSGTVG